MNLDTFTISIYVDENKFFSFEPGKERENHFEPMLIDIESQILRLADKLKMEYPELQFEVE